MRLLGIASLVALVACADHGVTDLDIVRRYCVFKGDTIGTLIVSDHETHVITQCVALTALVTFCDTVPLVRRPPVSCVVGKRI